VRSASARRPGNRSAAVALDLPIGPRGLHGRLWAGRAQMEDHLRWGEADAAAFVMRSLNILPPSPQRLVAGQISQRWFFNLLVSVFPGTRRQHRVLGARIEEVYPVPAPADGVGLAIGAMTWGRSMSTGILAGAVLVWDVDLLASGITAAFGDFQAAGRQAGG
jgi:diacylglycerol O-acyltransferase